MSYFNQLPIEELETSIDQYPDEPEVRAALIKRLAAEGDIDAAIKRAIRYASHSVTGRGTQTSYASADDFGD